MSKYAIVYSSQYPVVLSFHIEKAQTYGPVILPQWMEYNIFNDLWQDFKHTNIFLKLFLSELFEIRF